MVFPVKLRISIEREADGRWLGCVETLPGVLAYGKSRAEAARATAVLALHVVADRLEHGEFEGAKRHVSPFDVHIETTQRRKRRAA